MNRTVLSCLAAVALAGAATVAVNTVAQAEDCYGLNAGRVCVTPEPNNFPSVNPSSSSIEECVHVGAHCHPVTAPVPGVSTAPSGVVFLNCYSDVLLPDSSCREELQQD